MLLYVAIRATGNIHNFQKHIQKAYFQAVLKVFKLFQRPFWAKKTFLESSNTDPGGFVAQKSVSATANPLWLVSLLSRRVFSAQGSPQNRFKISQELPGDDLSVCVFKNSVQYNVCNQDGNIKHLSAQFLKKDGNDSLCGHESVGGGGVRIIDGTQLL